MAKNWSEILRSMQTASAGLGKAAPDTMRAFGGLASAAMADGALTTKTKELMAIAVSISIRCESCIAYHTYRAIKLGATREEVIDTISVAVELGGGPSTVYGSEALEAFDQLSS